MGLKFGYEALNDFERLKKVEFVSTFNLFNTFSNLWKKNLIYLILCCFENFLSFVNCIWICI